MIEVNTGKINLNHGNPGDKNSLGHYVLEVRKSVTALEMAQGKEDSYVKFDSIGLFFCPAAGAEGLFATGRIDSRTGQVNVLTYDYFASLPFAEFNFRYERS